MYQRMDFNSITFRVLLICIKNVIRILIQQKSTLLLPVIIVNTEIKYIDAEEAMRW